MLLLEGECYELNFSRFIHWCACSVHLGGRVTVVSWSGRRCNLLVHEINTFIAVFSPQEQLLWTHLCIQVPFPF